LSQDFSASSKIVNHLLLLEYLSDNKFNVFKRLAGICLFCKIFILKTTVFLIVMPKKVRWWEIHESVNHLIIKNLVMWRHYNVIFENKIILYVRPWQRLEISDNWNHLMHSHDMKYIGFKHQRENKQNSDNILRYNDVTLPNSW
jgi:hypothetical protein